MENFINTFYNSKKIEKWKKKKIKRVKNYIKKVKEN